MTGLYRVANQVRLALFILAYNLWNRLRRLCLPKAVKHWSLRSLQVKLIKLRKLRAFVAEMPAAAYEPNSPMCSTSVLTEESHYRVDV